MSVKQDKPPAYACCDNPSPAILEKNGRLFCRNCRSYLDKATDGSRQQAEEAKRAEGGR